MSRFKIFKITCPYFGVTDFEYRTWSFLEAEEVAEEYIEQKFNDTDSDVQTDMVNNLELRVVVDGEEFKVDIEYEPVFMVRKVVE